MGILTVSNIAKSFGIDLLFENVNLTISDGDKIGLVGRNGSGKTTLLRILLGQETPDSGRISLASGRRIGYVRQEAPVHPHHTIIEEINTVFAPVRAIQAQMEQIEVHLEAVSDEAIVSSALERYAALSDAFEAAGGLTIESDIELVLQRLGFKPEDYTKSVGSCSGGEQTRLALAKMVLSKPDILILDEPTNHLDIEATEWLEEFLKSYEGAVILVSHDRYFLDTVCTAVADLDNLSVSVYKGNYTQFWQIKQDQLNRQAALFKQQQDEVNRLEDVIKKNMGQDSVQSKMRHRIQGRIDRMDRVDRPKSDGANVRAAIDSSSAGRAGRDVLTIENLEKSFGEKTLFRGLNLLIERGHRIGLVGPNGSGKTTLVKIILGLEQATHGLITLGHNVRIAYFSQHAADSLPMNVSVLDSLLQVADMTSTEARNYLARFLFTGDDVFKLVGSLSGGEKNKLALARMVLEPCNLLILDEPTNHLDIASCESLTDLLVHYEGTLLLVSHDRYLLNATTSRTVVMNKGVAPSLFEGSYSDWRRSKSNQTGTPPPILPKFNGATRKIDKQDTPESFEDRLALLNARELSKMRIKSKDAMRTAELRVETLENRVATVEAELSSASGDMKNLVELAAEHTKLQDDVLEALTQWESKTAEFDMIVRIMDKAPTT